MVEAEGLGPVKSAASASDEVVVVERENVVEVRQRGLELLHYLTTLCDVDLAFGRDKQLFGTVVDPSLPDAFFVFNRVDSVAF